MFHIHVHFGSGSAPASGPAAQAIGDGTLLRLIAQYGPQLLALLIQLGLLKLPVGVTVPDASDAP